MVLAGEVGGKVVVLVIRCGVKDEVGTVVPGDWEDPDIVGADEELETEGSKVGDDDEGGDDDDDAIGVDVELTRVGTKPEVVPVVKVIVVVEDSKRGSKPVVGV